MISYKNILYILICILFSTSVYGSEDSAHQYKHYCYHNGLLSTIYSSNSNKKQACANLGYNGELMHKKSCSDYPWTAWHIKNCPINEGTSVVQLFSLLADSFRRGHCNQIYYKKEGIQIKIEFKEGRRLAGISIPVLESLKNIYETHKHSHEELRQQFVQLFQKQKRNIPSFGQTKRTVNRFFEDTTGLKPLYDINCIKQPLSY